MNDAKKEIYHVFISFKHTNENAEETKEYQVAQKPYKDLTNIGIRKSTLF